MSLGIACIHGKGCDPPDDHLYHALATRQNMEHSRNKCIKQDHIRGPLMVHAGHPAIMCWDMVRHIPRIVCQQAMFLTFL